MQQKPSRQLLESNFPPSVRSRIYPAICRGYGLANQLVQNIEILDWAVGRDNLPYLRRISVEYEIYRAFTNGVNGIVSRINTNSNGIYHHVELVSPEIIVTASCVSSPKVFPRKAVYRENYRLSNQVRLPFDLDDWNEEHSGYYGLITYGYQGATPQFAVLGLPEPVEKAWISHLEIHNEPYAIITNRDEEIIDDEDLVALKEFSEKVVGDAK